MVDASHGCEVYVPLALRSTGYASYIEQSMKRVAHGPAPQARTSEPLCHPPCQDRCSPQGEDNLLYALVAPPVCRAVTVTILSREGV